MLRLAPANERIVRRRRIRHASRSAAGVQHRRPAGDARARAAGSFRSRPGRGSSRSAARSPADIHGKNHHRDGSFGNHVTRMRMMLADTTVVELGPRPTTPSCSGRRSAAWASPGVILDATFRLIPIETSRMSVETHRIGDLDEIMARMAESDADFRYSVAWIDLLAEGQAPRSRCAHQRRARHLRTISAPGDAVDPLALRRPATRRGARRWCRRRA